MTCPSVSSRFLRFWDPVAPGRRYALGQEPACQVVTISANNALGQDPVPAAGSGSGRCGLVAEHAPAQEADTIDANQCDIARSRPAVHDVSGAIVCSPAAQVGSNRSKRGTWLPVRLQREHQRRRSTLHCPRQCVTGWGREMWPSWWRGARGRMVPPRHNNTSSRPICRTRWPMTTVESEILAIGMTVAIFHTRQSKYEI
jgi:hypothetical protein